MSGEGHLAKYAIHVSAIQRPFSHGIKTALFHDPTRFHGTFHMGNDDARCIGFKGLDIVAVGALAYPRDFIHVVDFCRSDAVLDILPVVRHVLSAKPDGRRSGQSGQFDDVGMGDVDFDAGGLAAFPDVP